jgi:hypothetical protein
MWPKQRNKLTIHLNPTDIIFFRCIDRNGYPAGVGTGNAGKYCTVIIGHKEIEGIQKVREFRGVEEFTGLSIVSSSNSRENFPTRKTCNNFVIYL